jgi:hypothetical protein
MILLKNSQLSQELALLFPEKYNMGLLIPYLIAPMTAYTAQLNPPDLLLDQAFVQDTMRSWLAQVLSQFTPKLTSVLAFCSNAKELAAKKQSIIKEIAVLEYMYKPPTAISWLNPDDSWSKVFSF